MGVGLGKNSAVVLSLGKENYEALITRHGQWVRWRVATKCSCVDKYTFSPNIHCTKCGGRGWLYSYQKEKETCIIIMAKDDSKILTLPNDEYKDCKLKGVYNRKNERFTNAVKKDNYVILNSKVTKGEYYTIILTQSLEHYISQPVFPTRISAGCYRLDTLTVNRKGIDGLYYNAPCDIISIDKIVDENNNLYTMAEARQNEFYLKENIGDDGNSVPIGNKITVTGIHYIEPATFILLSQNLDNKDAQDVVDAKGDAIVTFPYNYNVSQGDIITVLAGTYTNKEVLTRASTETDTLDAYFVDSIVNISSENREYTEKDYILLGSNKIKWLCDDAPAVNTNYSITYNIYPTYTVLKNIPQLRTSENQRIPRKAVVKLMATYSDSAKISRQV